MRNLFLTGCLLGAVLLSAGCSQTVKDDPSLWPIEPVEIFIQLCNDLGDNLLEDATDGNWSECTFQCRFDGVNYSCDRNTEIDQGHVWDEDFFYGITISGIYISEAVVSPTISFGAISGKRELDDDIVFDWPDGTRDTVHVKNHFYYNEKGYPITQRRIFINGEECSNLITLVKNELETENFE